MANPFTYYTPTKIVFGKDTETQAGALCRAYGATKVLLHYGGQSAVRSGLIDRIKKSLDEEKLPYAELGGVVPNPELRKVREGVALGSKEKVDFVLAVGGGSVIDSAKLIAYTLAEPEFDAWSLHAKTRAAKKCLPIGCVLTIAAAGSEMSNSCVITNEETGEKRGYSSDLCRAKFAILNPALTKTLPDYQTQAGCTDIMMHTMERYFTGTGNMALTDTLAEGLLRTVRKNAEILHKDPANYDARAEVMWASSLSHNGLTGCGNGGNDFASHGMEHELSGMFGVTHGAGLAAIWGSWARYVYRECLHRFVKYAVNVWDIAPDKARWKEIFASAQISEEALANRPADIPAFTETDGLSFLSDADRAYLEEIALRGIEATEAFFVRIGMPTSLKALGVEPTDAQIEEMADSAAKAFGGFRGSAKKIYRDDMVAIYKAAR